MHLFRYWNFHLNNTSSSNLNDQIALLERRLTREKKSREMAEQLLAQKSREIYVANQSLKDALLESEQKRDELQFLLSTSSSLSLGINNTNLLNNVTELTCSFLNAVWGLSEVQHTSNPKFNFSTKICDSSKQWSSNFYFIKKVNEILALQPATKNWNVVEINHKSIYPYPLKMLYVGKQIDHDTILLSAFLLKNAPASSETFDALTIIQRQVKTFLIARKNGTLITETKDNLDTIQEQLTQAKNQLVQSEKMASLGQLAAGIAHEINNPIGYIRSNLEMLSNHMMTINTFINELSKEKSAEFLRYFTQNDIEYILDDTKDILTSNIEGVDRVSEIVTALKTFSHQSDNDFKSFSIVDTVSTALKVVQNELKYKHHVEHNINKADLLVFGKSGQIQQVFVNLFVNAAHAMPDGGIVSITYLKINDECHIKVKDNGSGMSVDTQNQLFNPFYTTKSVGNGTGLGLSISYSIMQSHKGDIKVESSLGEGTTFTVILPLASKVL